MNYRHAYHAGNFADVLKHVVLSLVIEHLKRKPQPFRLIDVHAGTGRYDLEGEEARRTGEWKNGIDRLREGGIASHAAGLLKPYLDAVRKFNSEGALKVYPGSPLVARTLMRPCDTLIANELHPEDEKRLRAALAAAPNSKVTNFDAWTGIKALLPPKERRGLVLIDPPYEAMDEFDRLALGLEAAIERFANGIYLIWYPVKDPAAVARFMRKTTSLPIAERLDVRLRIAAPEATERLAEAGILVLNPPYQLKENLAVVLPELARLLAAGPGAGFALDG